MMIWLFHEWLGGHGEVYPAVTTMSLLEYKKEK
jgi:hypothetical protein